MSIHYLVGKELASLISLSAVSLRLKNSSLPVLSISIDIPSASEVYTSQLHQHSSHHCLYVLSLNLEPHISYKSNVRFSAVKDIFR